MLRKQDDLEDLPEGPGAGIRPPGTVCLLWEQKQVFGSTTVPRMVVPGLQGHKFKAHTGVRPHLYPGSSQRYLQGMYSSWKSTDQRACPEDRPSVDG